MNNLNMKKPKLVESKLVDYYTEQYRQKDLVKQGLTEKTNNEVEANKSFFTNFSELFISFMKDNWGFVLILVLLTVLLLLRWREVSNKKKVINKNNI
jgi:hypothetical protein